MLADKSAGVTIVGAGPAGMGILVAAANLGRLRELFAKGVTILERRNEIGAGALGGYDINSDSHADSFLRCLDGAFGRQFPELRAHPATRALETCRGRAVPLRLAADFLAALAHPLRAFAADGGQPILTGTPALDATRAIDGRWIVRARSDSGGAEINILSRSLVIATGAEQSAARLADLSVAGQPLWSRYRGKLVLSRDVLAPLPRELLRRSLAAAASPRVAIVGGSHSAMSAAGALLALPGIAWEPGSIAILHRKPLRPMYPTPELAVAEGYRAFGPRDICGTTGRVFPLAGFRADSRELLLRAMGLGGRPVEERIALFDLRDGDTRGAARHLEDADLIVAATGYRPLALPLIDQRGRRITLHGENAVAPLVDRRSRVLDRAGRPIAGVFGIGLSAGFPLGGTHGEPSFRGEANGLALWHGDIGEAIVRAVLDAKVRVVPEPAGIGARPARGRVKAHA